MGGEEALAGSRHGVGGEKQLLHPGAGGRGGEEALAGAMEVEERSSYDRCTGGGG